MVDIYFRPTSWELKEILEGEQEDVDSYLDAAKFICSVEDVFDPIEDEEEEEASEEKLTCDYQSVSMETSSEYDEPQWNDKISYENVRSHLPPTIPKPKFNVPISSKVYILLSIYVCCDQLFTPRRMCEGYHIIVLCVNVHVCLSVITLAASSN